MSFLAWIGYIPVTPQSTIKPESLSSNPNEPVLEQKGSTSVPIGRFVSYLKARKIISKGDIYHLFQVKDSKFDAPTLQSIPMVNEFPKAFPEDLLRVPPKLEIDFEIDLLPDTQPISILPYRIAPAELKKLKEKLKDLLDKGFIRTNISPWGTPIFFVRKKMVLSECVSTTVS